MRCPKCQALSRQHSQECEIEARAILEQQLMSKRGPIPAEPPTEQEIVKSRKRQMEISSMLHVHRTRDHAA